MKQSYCYRRQSLSLAVFKQYSQQGGLSMKDTEQQTLLNFGDLIEEKNESSLVIRENLPQIATVMDSERATKAYLNFIRREIDEEAFDKELDNCVLKYGMTREEIEQYFPPSKTGNHDLTYNRTQLIANIIMEEKRLVGKDRREGNIRHFWYTNLMYTIMRVMGDTNIPSIFSTYSKVRRKLVKELGFRYSDINLTSSKSELCESLFEDSPYPNILIACEKESYHDHLKRLADIFHITYISLGGQGSYKVYEDLALDFYEAGIDINQEFYIFTVSDFDPQGYEIQNTAKEHLERAGIREVAIHRVYLRQEHITERIVERFAIPYDWEKGRDSSTKAALTLYNKFGKRTGGIYLKNDDWIRFSKNGNGYEVPQFEDSAEGYDLYRVELDNFEDDVLLQLLIDALEDFIDGSEYYYKKAEDAAKKKLDSMSLEEAWEEIGKAVEAKHKDKYEEKHSLEVGLSKVNEEMTQDIRDLKEAIEADYEYRDSEIQSNISTINEAIREVEEERDRKIQEIEEEAEEQINNLEVQRYPYERDRDDLWNRRYNILNILNSIEAERTQQVAELSRQLTEKVEEPLDNYKFWTQQELREDVAEQAKKEPLPIKDWVDFEDKKGEVFEAAREGKEEFEVDDLDYSIVNSLRHEVWRELRKRLEYMSESGLIELPEPPDDVKQIPEVIEDIKEQLGDVEPNDLPDELRHRYLILKKVFFDDDLDYYLSHMYNMIWDSDDIEFHLDNLEITEDNNEN